MNSMTATARVSNLAEIPLALAKATTIKQAISRLIIHTAGKYETGGCSG